MEDENIVYFRSNLPQLRGIYLHEIGEKIPRMIAKQIHATSLYPSDWKDFAAEIGIDDYFVLQDIEISAGLKQEPALCVAFSSLLQYRFTVHDVIQALIRLERVDILHLIREEFGAFLEERENRMLSCASSSSDQNSAADVTKEEFPEDNSTETHGDNFSNIQSERREMENHGSSAALESHSSGHREANELVTESESWVCAGADGFSFKSLHSLEQDKKLSDIPVIKCSCNYPTKLKVTLSKSSPTAPLKPISERHEPISVFIPYVKSRTETGIKLANHLRKAGFKVITISEAEFMIRIDRSSFLKVLLEKVDFIVPVISEEYILYARPSGKLNKFDNDAKTNRFIFRWFHLEFENNCCYNIRVMPVIVEEFDKRLIANEPILQWAHQLWNEVDDLVEYLRNTKLMHVEMVKWNRKEFVSQLMDYLNQN